MTDLFVDGLAVFRMWRLVAKDDVTEDIRQRFVKWSAKTGRHRWVFFVTCPWCLGFWLCVVAVAVRRTRLWSVVRTVFATSAVVGVVAEWESRLSH